MALGRKRLQLTLLLLGLVLGSCLDLGTGNQGHSHSSGFCAHHDHEPHDHDHKCGEGHDHVHQKISKMTFGSEEEDEEDMELYEFGSPHHHDHDHDHEHHHSIGDTDLSGLGLWLNALGCSFLVSMASLICLIILPVIFVQGKPSKAFVDSLALFGAGAMLGDAFLHQLPHAFGGEHSHSHGSHADHGHDASSGHGHSHSLADLSTGISILAGIVLFLLVEKIVRYVEENSRGANSWSHGHHHHNHNSTKKLKDDKVSHDSLKGDNPAQPESSLRKRIGSSAAKDDNLNAGAVDSSTDNIKSLNVKEPVKSSTSLVFGYLNLFSDGVHNFTDGMALGSAFMLYGSVGGWSRTLFLLAHELPQEVGDFGILIRSGFSIPKALFFNFLSALVALAGTALALLWGKDPGQSSLIEGFTAGGFIYIAIAGVLAEMNSSGNTTLRSTAIQIISLTMGMSVALGISLVE
ncbi:IAA-alanine resistance protein 1 isoform X1 [Gastrolobium bilobum]|uniref:IAA-alanine resistance protein 1 isoform X1 n=1 Tax=Gastrolobium bilobum TaxID=150636 RepID=UPI002AB09A30|nr:IAA-alanine resistance protein 1 isoform X1 [Gastrolobium bilobum]